MPVNKHEVLFDSSNVLVIMQRQFQLSVTLINMRRSQFRILKVLSEKLQSQFLKPEVLSANCRRVQKRKRGVISR